MKFAKKITENESLFTLHDGNGKITLSLDGAKKKTAGKVTNTSTEFDKDATKLTKLTTLDKLSAKILYADILDDVDIEYIAESLNIKENIIVKKASDSYSYTFTLKLYNLTAEQRADGSIVISSPTDGRTVYAGYWTYAGRNTSSIPSSVGNDQCIALNGTTNGISYAKQQIKFGYSAGNNTEKHSISDNDVLILSGWAKADSVPTDGDALFELYAEVHYIDDATAPEAFVIPFN